MIIVIATKAWTGRGTPLRGGLPSGHAAVAFAGWMAATYIVGDSPPLRRSASLTFIMALLVAQTRVESGVHSALEVAYGGAARRARHPVDLPALCEQRSSTSAPSRSRERAYAPYSNYLVGAAVRTRDGRVFEGVNVENAAYPLGVCAEKSALVKAVSEGYRPGDIEAIGITASPCGGCRQWLYEFRIDEVTFLNASRRARHVFGGRPAAGHVGPA